MVGRERRCIDPKSDVGSLTGKGRTPLHEAAARGNVADATTLLDAGFDVNAEDMRFMTPLMFAAQNQHTALVALLIASGADLDAENDLGMTALWLAVANAQQSVNNGGAVIGQLRDAGADPYMACFFGSSPISEARRPTANMILVARWFSDLPEEIPQPDINLLDPPSCKRCSSSMEFDGLGEAGRWICPACGLARLI